MKKSLITFAVLLLCLQLPAQDSGLLTMASNCGTAEQLEFLKESVAATDDGYKDLYIGMALHNISLSDIEQVEEAITRLTRVWEQKQSIVAKAYLGSAITIRAGKYFTQGNILEASADLSEGVELLDEAVTQAPGDQTIRILRIINSFALSDSSPVPRYDVIRDDLGFIKKDINPENKSLQVFYWFYSGRYFLAMGLWDNAFAALEKAIVADPDSGLAAEAEELLWELEE